MIASSNNRTGFVERPVRGLDSENDKRRENT